MNSLAEIAALLKKPCATLITTHIMPDGDSIGSLLGLGRALAKVYPVTMYSADPVPRRYSFLDGGGEIVTGETDLEPFERVIVLDCSDHLRIKPIWEAVRGKTVVNIDHHATNELFGHYNYVDVKAAATGEIVALLLKEMELPVDFPVAQALYVAIASDSGSFKFESTTPRTHQVAAGLLEAGVLPGEISPLIFDERSREATVILAAALNSLAFSGDGRLAWMKVTEKDMAAAGAKDEDLEGVVNFAKNIEGVEVGLLFREKTDKTVKVGFRSKTVDVSKVAKALGGGGHARAAGCSLEMSLEEAVELVLETLRPVME